MSTAAQRSGFAVATALFALVVVGALAVGTLFAATQQLRSGSDAIHQARAIMAAELGVEQAIAAWNRAWNGALARGFGKSWTLSTAEGADVKVRVTRLGDELFVLASDARAGPARRHIARLVRLDVDDPPLLATLAADSVLAVGATAAIDGSDRIPLGWDCAAPGPPLPAVAVTDTSALRRFGHFDWDELVEVANAHLSDRIASPSPRSSDEECDTTDPGNWGEPSRVNGGACTSFYPVVHAPGDLLIDGGRGQGMLLVDGDLTVQGGFEFFGAVLVRGALRGGRGGARITGVVSMVMQGATEPLLDEIAVYFSRCAARKALLDIARPVPLKEQSWYEVFDP